MVFGVSIYLVSAPDLHQATRDAKTSNTLFKSPLTKQGENRTTAALHCDTAILTYMLKLRFRVMTRQLSVLFIPSHRFRAQRLYERNITTVTCAQTTPCVRKMTPCVLPLH